MGFFSSDKLAPTGLPSLTQQRMIALFDEKKWAYFVDHQGDLGGLWDGNQFYFLLRGEQNEVLLVSARWHASLPFERLDAVREFLNMWNRDKLWPKCYHRINDDGRIIINAELAADFEFGVNDAQLLQTLECALGTASSFFSALDSEFLR